ncbi:MAG TPA: zinc-ribbon domain-containing protein [Rhizomicrobium sp.]|jgi:predicted Zn finger-like uncharacterized protein|nr:zinc-ribbon domain-containing protein [Rhizomicrobium sp.]
MIITCPQCETRYTADAANFPAQGRKVRCSKCGQVWNQVPPEPEHALAPEPISASEAAEPAAGAAPSFLTTRATAIPHAQAPRRSWAERIGLIAGWAGLAAMLVLIGWMGLRFRQQIETLWPQSSAFYATFGVKVNSGGVEINDVTYRHETENGRSVLEVTGRLVNVSAHQAAVPRVRVSLTDDDQRELKHWIYSPPLKTLGAGQSIAFSTRLWPTPAAKHFQLHFASQD